MDDLRPASRVESPPFALWLIALVAIAPFPVTAFIYCYGPPSEARPALTGLLTWAAMVLSFLGGVRWGLETREPRPRALRQTFSALTAIVAWVVLLSRGRMPDSWILAGLIVAFLIQWVFDHQTPGTPRRYPLLSTTLTGCAGVSLGLVLEKSLNG